MRARFVVRSPAQGLKTIRHPAITENYQRSLRWRPRAKRAVLLPCASVKPFSASATHASGYLPALEGKPHDRFVVSEPLGVVPYAWEQTWPNDAYDFPPENLRGQARDELVARIAEWWRRVGARYERVYLALPEHHRRLAAEALELAQGHPDVVDVGQGACLEAGGCPPGHYRATSRSYRDWLRRKVNPSVKNPIKALLGKSREPVEILGPAWPGHLEYWDARLEDGGEGYVPAYELYTPKGERWLVPRRKGGKAWKANPAAPQELLHRARHGDASAAAELCCDLPTFAMKDALGHFGARLLRLSADRASMALRAYYRMLGYRDAEYGALTAPDGSARLVFSRRVLVVQRPGPAGWVKAGSVPLMAWVRKLLGTVAPRVARNPPPCGDEQLKALGWEELEDAHAFLGSQSRDYRTDLFHELRVAASRGDLQEVKLLFGEYEGADDATDFHVDFVPDDMIGEYVRVWLRFRPLGENPPKGEEAWRRAEREGPADLDARLRLEAETLRRGGDWHQRIQAPTILWTEGALGLVNWEGAELVLVNTGELYPRRLKIARWLLHRLIVGDYKHGEAIELWKRWEAQAPKRDRQYVLQAVGHRNYQNTLAAYLADSFLEEAMTGVWDWVLNEPLELLEIRA